MYQSVYVRFALFSICCASLTNHSMGASWIDDDTPQNARTTEPLTDIWNGEDFQLIMSDEFNVPGRRFSDGSDPMWTALDKNDYTNAALQYYDSDYVYTDDEGHLVIETAAKDTDIIGYDDVKREHTHVKKHFRSAMLQSWNKFCYTGGIIEIEVILPGKWNVAGLWPAFWLLGNLSRHTYVGSADGVWPWSQIECTDVAKRYVLAQKLSPCHSVSHYDMKPGIGRGSPEIDIFEVQPGPLKPGEGPFWQTWVAQPLQSASYQVAPGKWWRRPGPGYWPGPGEWYNGIEQGPGTSINIGYYGNYNWFRGEVNHERDYWSDAISWNHQLHPTNFEKPHRYRLEWGLPTEDETAVKEGYGHGFLNWYDDDVLVLSLKGESIYNVTTASTSTEPSYIILNTAISTTWGFPKCPLGCPCQDFDCNSIRADHQCGFPTGFCDMMKEGNPKYKINWIRAYQNPKDPSQKVGCSTPERPTRSYIEANKYLYMTENDKEPLKKIIKGGGTCNTTFATSLVLPETCGGILRGTCSERTQKCSCTEGWTGPNCLAREKGNPFEWDPDPTIADVGYYSPLSNSAFYFLIIAGIICLIFVVYGEKVRSLSEFKPIPESDFFA